MVGLFKSINVNIGRTKGGRKQKKFCILLLEGVAVLYFLEKRKMEDWLIFYGNLFVGLVVGNGKAKL